MINATKKWIFLKASSIVLVPLMAWFVLIWYQFMTKIMLIL